MRKIIIYATLFLFSGPALSGPTALVGGYKESALDSYITSVIIQELVMDNFQFSSITNLRLLDAQDLIEKQVEKHQNQYNFISRFIVYLKNMERDRPELWQEFQQRREDYNTTSYKVKIMAAKDITITENDNITNEQMMEYLVKYLFENVAEDLRKSLNMLVNLELVSRQNIEPSQEKPGRGLWGEIVQKVKGTCRRAFGG